MKTNDEWIRTSKRLLEDIWSIPGHRLNGSQSFEFTLYGPRNNDSWSELDVIQKALEHLVAHLQGKNPCPEAVPCYIVSKEKAKKLKKSGKARRLRERPV